MTDEFKKHLDLGLQALQSFQCEHKIPCDPEKTPERGGCCNSCWARSWARKADGLRKLESAQA